MGGSGETQEEEREQEEEEELEEQASAPRPAPSRLAPTPLLPHSSRQKRTYSIVDTRRINFQNLRRINSTNSPGSLLSSGVS
ncbi:hypothetical protein E2C01_005961 [Portunus trituberculatus]|uniref:Uncharacterized protein n=1 Tax=Portunus trituberculatus TaxID=210409 RepID=A0A5B7CXZ8_PORTR|nr:hypothetical protein [Portunus trituberculatus]